MKIRMYQVDAFTSSVFGGNPAAVCPLEHWLPDEVLQQIAMENNLAETAFYVAEGNMFTIRWFTPTVEVDLCGHATLAAAHALFHFENYTGNEIHFRSPRSGPLPVTRNGDWLTLNFPSDVYTHVPVTDDLIACFGKKPHEAFRGKTDLMLVFETENDIVTCKPDLLQIATLGGRGVIVTAPGTSSDFVSRFFAPQAGINEDPVTGSAHTTLTPYWAGLLGRTELTAMQLSARKGFLKCKHLGDRVEISGQAVAYLEGTITIV